MYKRAPIENGFTVELSASFEGIDSVCRDVKELIKTQQLEEYSFDIILCVREALSNAVRHGSKMDPSKKVVFLFEADSTRIIFRVTDSGQGFDWRKAEKKQASPTSTHGRGIDILKLYFDSHRYNEAGNEIELVKKINIGRQCMSKVTRVGDRLTIQPKTDIAGAKVDKLKEEFKKALEDGISTLVVDMAKIEMIDSMGIGLLIASHNSLSKKNRQLELTNVSNDITKLLKLMRLDQHFIINQK